MNRSDRHEDMDRLADTIEAVIPPREGGKQWLFSLSHVGETVEIAVPGRDEDDPEVPPRYEAFAEAFREETDEPWPHGRLYPNLDTLVDKGLVKKGELDQRTNKYGLTERGRREL